jgi:hypothetical protein
MTLLRQVEVVVANGRTTSEGCREADVTEQRFYRWRKEYGGLTLDSDYQSFDEVVVCLPRFLDEVYNPVALGLGLCQAGEFEQRWTSAGPILCAQVVQPEGFTSTLRDYG